MPKTSNFKFIDLFAGIGGLSRPFLELGGECVFASEWDKFAQETYEANYGHKPAGDITQIDPELIPDFDLLLAGFPCQPFSHAGLRKGFDDMRGTLFFNIAEILRTKRPKAAVLENVKGLLSHDKGNTFRRIVEVLEKDLGYTVHHKILNARDFGLPQNRERVYIVAILNPSHAFEFPRPSNTATRLGDILEDLTPEKIDKYTLSDRLWASHQRRKADHIAKGNGFGFSLFNEQSPYTSTISARYYKDGSEILVSNLGRNPRKLTPREAARLQGFPDDFIIPVSDTQAYKQFGNSVAVPVVRAIAKSLKASLNN